MTVRTSDSENDAGILADIIKIENTKESPQKSIFLDFKVIYQFFDERSNEANELFAAST